LAQRRDLAAAYPLRPGYRENVAMCLSDFGFFCNREGRNEEALKLFTEGVTIMTELAKTDPKKPLYRRHLGVVLTNRARVLAALGRFKESSEDLAFAAREHSAAMLLDPQGTGTFVNDQWNKVIAPRKSAGEAVPTR